MGELAEIVRLKMEGAEGAEDRFQSFMTSLLRIKAEQEPQATSSSSDVRAQSQTEERD